MYEEEKSDWPSVFNTFYLNKNNVVLNSLLQANFYLKPVLYFVSDFTSR